MMLISEVTNLTGLSRRAIQEYENYPKKIAIKPTQKNKYGHLLYGDEEVRRLWLLRFFRELGYSKDSIAKIFEKADYDMSCCLEKAIPELEKKVKEIENLIDIAKYMKESGIGPEIFRIPALNAEAIQFDDAMRLMGEMTRTFKSENDNYQEDSFDPEEEKALDSALEIVCKYAEEGAEISFPKVQEEIKNIHKIMCKDFSESIIYFAVIANQFSEKKEVAIIIDEIYGEGKAKYFYDACMYYCDCNRDNEFDRQFSDAVDNIIELAKQRKSTGSKEVQAEVSRMYGFFNTIHFGTEEEKINMFRNLSEFFGSDTFKNIFDSGREKGLAWFLSRSIEIYCDYRVVS